MDEHTNEQVQVKITNVKNGNWHYRCRSRWAHISLGACRGKLFCDCRCARATGRQFSKLGQSLVWTENSFFLIYSETHIRDRSFRAGAGILPHPDSEGHELQAESFKYYWALAHRDPTSGVQVCVVHPFVV